MRTTLIAATVAALLTPLGAAIAHADNSPTCDFTQTCDYSPGYNGPLLNTWDVPGTYGGWTNSPVICSPLSYRCSQYAVPGNGPLPPINGPLPPGE